MSLLSELRAATKGLLFLSESDAPLKPFVWKGVVVSSGEALLAHLEKDAATPVQEVELTKFFAPMVTPQDGDDDEARADRARFQALVVRLAMLSDTRAFRLGAGPEIMVYVIGKTPEGGTAGVSTMLTET